MEGWRPVEDIDRWGFGQAPVVRANEFHSGWARCVRTRVIGARMIRAAREAGVRRPAMEALDLGWTLWAYEHQFDPASRRDPAYLLSMEFTSWRERQQAANLGRLLESAPGEPMLVWCGNSHACKGRPGSCGRRLPRRWISKPEVDALVVSTDNELTGDEA